MDTPPRKVQPQDIGQDVPPVATVSPVTLLSDITMAAPAVREHILVLVC